MGRHKKVKVKEVAELLNAVDAVDISNVITSEKPTVLKLIKEEQLELQNIGLKRQVLEASVSKEVEHLERLQASVIANINHRLHIDLNQYHVNVETGELTKATGPARVD